MPSKKHVTRPMVYFHVGIILAFVTEARADDVYWDNGGSGIDWELDANWSSNNQPGSLGHTTEWIGGDTILLLPVSH